MNRTINLQQLKGLFLVKGLLALLLVAPSVATAAGTGTATLDDIKDTNYSVPAEAYFVSPDGKDTNTGRSYNSPWSATKALASAPSGATIVFKGGVYRNVDSSITKKLTLQAYPHEKPLLKGSIEVTGWVSDGNIWRKDGWTYSFALPIRSESIDPNYPLAGHTDMVYVNDVALRQVASKSKVVSGTFYVDYANNKLYIGSQPSGKTVEATALSEAIKIRRTEASNTVVQGLGFAHYADSPIRVGTPSVKLENNTFVWNGEQGVKFISGTDAIVRGNIFSYNGLKGLGGAADRILVEGNTISYNNIEYFNRKWAAAGAKFIRTEGLVFRNNLVENNFAAGLWMDISNSNATVVNNTVRSNEGIGIFLELSDKAIIAANVAHHNNVGIMLSDSSNARVYNNTLSLNKTQILVKDSSRKNTNPKEIAAGITWITSNNVLKNNIFSDAGNTALQASGCQTSASMVADTDYNIYYDTSARNVFDWSLRQGKCSLTYTSLAAFKLATGFEQHGQSVGNVATNPLFVNEASGDYRLKADSPAIGRGQILQADIASAVGWKSGVPTDMGALQSKVVLVR